MVDTRKIRAKVYMSVSFLHNITEGAAETI